LPVAQSTTVELVIHLRTAQAQGDATLMLTRKGQDLLAVVALMAMLAVASTLAMIRIGVSQRPVDFTLNPSLLGYTFSLALFVVPCVVFGVWV
jgi:hypothetical protein